MRRHALASSRRRPHARRAARRVARSPSTWPRCSSRSPGSSLDWIRVAPDSEWAGLTLRTPRIHTNTGVSVVALLDGDNVTAAPGADDVLAPGSQVVAIGTPEGLERSRERLAGS